MARALSARAGLLHQSDAAWPETACGNDARPMTNLFEQLSLRKRRHASLPGHRIELLILGHSPADR